MEDIHRTKVRLKEEIVHGKKSLDAINIYDKLEIVKTFIEEYKDECDLYQTLLLFLSTDDHNNDEIKEKIIDSIISENYDVLDDIFDEAHADYLEDVHRYEHWQNV